MYEAWFSFVVYVVFLVYTVILVASDRPSMAAAILLMSAAWFKLASWCAQQHALRLARHGRMG